LNKSVFSILGWFFILIGQYIFPIKYQTLDFLHKVCNYCVEDVHAGICQLKVGCGQIPPSPLSQGGHTKNESLIDIIFYFFFIIWHEDFFEFVDIFDSLIGSEVEEEFFD